MTIAGITGKVALIIGGGWETGRATAHAFAARGAKAVVADRGRESGEETVTMIKDDGGESTVIRTDVTAARR
jgi:NAD(P)-dependent dehydrogenase (short-subunit alcohol dehydrogenase family)